VSATLGIAQKGDAIIPIIGLPAHYRLSCDGITLPKDAYLLRVTVIAKKCASVGLGSVPPGWQSIFSQRGDEFQVELYPRRGSKLEQIRAIPAMFDQVVLVYPQESDDDLIMPAVTLEFEYWDLKAGVSVLTIDRFRLVEGLLKPNLPPATPTSDRGPR
jgi:hypothetical protein